MKKISKGSPKGSARKAASRVAAVPRDSVAPRWFSGAIKEAMKEHFTKKDSEQFATKNDLTVAIAGCATKDDLKEFATKENLSDAVDHLVDVMFSNFATKDDFSRLETRLEKNLVLVSQHERRIWALEERNPV